MQSSRSDNPLDQDMAETLHRIEAHLAGIRDGAPTLLRQWLTVQEVANELRVSRDTVERLIGSGRLKAAELRTPSSRGQRHRYRIRREWVEEFLLRNVKQGEAAEHRSTRRRRDTPERDFIG